jgi:hypothetical protein
MATATLAPVKAARSWNEENDNPFEKPIQYLYARGWRLHEGRWFAPEDLDAKGQPRGEREEKRPHRVMKTIMVQDPDRPRDPKAQIPQEVVHKEFDRVTLIPAPRGYLRDEAVQIQLARDEAQAAGKPAEAPAPAAKPK